MQTTELRELGDAELGEQHDEHKRQLFNLRFQLATGQLDDYSQLRKTKRSLARVLTVMRERELAALEAEEI